MVELRKLFLLRPDSVFLNHGSFGACPRPVFDAYQAWQLELERQPVEFIQRRLKELLYEARVSLGEFVGADPDDLVYVSNATTGLNIVARSIPLSPGDEVLSTDHEYGSLNRTWNYACGKRGAKYIQQSVPLPVTSSDQVVEASWAGVTDRTKVLFFSHITSPSALILPVNKLVRRARDAGIITVVDGADAAGQVPLNLEKLGADFYSGNCHKWMMAPKGSAFLHARRERQDLLEPLVGGRLDHRAKEPRLVIEHQYQGTRDMAAFLAVPSAIRFMHDHDWPDVRRQCHELARHARNKFFDLTGLAPPTPDSPEWFAQMVALRIPRDGIAELKQKLFDDHSIEITSTAWDDQYFLRLSVQGYTTRADVDLLIDAYTKLLPA